MLSSINTDFCQLFEMPLHDFTSYEVESYKNISAISASISDFQSTKLRLTIYNWEAW